MLIYNPLTLSGKNINLSIILNYTKIGSCIRLLLYIGLKCSCKIRYILPNPLKGKIQKHAYIGLMLCRNPISQVSYKLSL